MAYEQRSVIRFLWSKGRTPIKIHRGMQPTYGERCLALRSVRWWCSEFENGSENLIDSERAGRLRVSVTDDNTAHVGEMVKAEWCVRIKDIVQELHISFGSAFNIIHECLGYRKFSCRWVPKQLDDVMKGKWMIASLNHLQWYAEEGDNFLDRIVNGDKRWVLHYAPELKQQSMVWKHPQSPVRKKFRTAPSVHKVMLTAFWDCRGPLMLDFMPRDATINANRYCSTLSLLRAAIRKKCRRILNVDNVIILHDNARPHVANKTVNKLRKFHWEFLEHPPYSSDLAPNDFHLFSPLKTFLAGERFTCDDEVKAAVWQCFRSQTADFYRSGIAKLVLWWDNCLNWQGDYVEKEWKVQGIISTCLVGCMYLILPEIKYGQRLFDLPSYI